MENNCSRQSYITTNDGQRKNGSDYGPNRGTIQARPDGPQGNRILKGLCFFASGGQRAGMFKNIALWTPSSFKKLRQIFRLGFNVLIFQHHKHSHEKF